MFLFNEKKQKRLIKEYRHTTYKSCRFSCKVKDKNFDENKYYKEKLVPVERDPF